MRTEERLGVFLGAASMFTNKYPSEQREELLTVRLGLLVQANEKNET